MLPGAVNFYEILIGIETAQQLKDFFQPTTLSGES